MAEIWTDTVEGTIDGRWWFHYDVANDVLYVRRPEDPRHLRSAKSPTMA